MKNNVLVVFPAMLAALTLVACDKGHDEPGGDNPRVWSSPIANPEKPKTDDDYDGEKDAPEPVTPEQRRDP